MEFRKHLQVKEGDHAYLGASKYHWINYDAEKLESTYRRFLKAQQGTELHEFAAKCIKLRQKLPIMDKIKSFDKIIVTVKKEEGIE